MSFAFDENIQKAAEAYAASAVDYFQNNWSITLDGSDESIENIEKISDLFHKAISKEKPTEETIYDFAKCFGSYVGEVYRRNHGAQWGIVTLDEESFPGMRSDKTQALFWPWGRVQNRLINGPEDNIWDYYRSFLK